MSARFISKHAHLANHSLIGVETALHATEVRYNGSDYLQRFMLIFSNVVVEIRLHAAEICRKKFIYLSS
jgi:hypothetical protein